MSEPRKLRIGEVAERTAQGEHVTLARRVELLAELLTSRGYATTVRPLTVPLPAAGARGRSRPRTLVTAQLCHGHCPRAASRAGRSIG